jgi:SAM-dependent methyltransferase
MDSEAFAARRAVLVADAGLRGHAFASESDMASATPSWPRSRPERARLICGTRAAMLRISDEIEIEGPTRRRGFRTLSTGTGVQGRLTAASGELAAARAHRGYHEGAGGGARSVRSGARRRSAAMMRDDERSIAADAADRPGSSWAAGPPPNVKDHLQALYRQRFESEQAARHEVWRVLIDSWFIRYLDGVDSVLDLGSGWGHFINQVNVPARYAIDLNPDARLRLDPAVDLVAGDAMEPWPLAGGVLDCVFTSNFLEHLPGRDAVSTVLDHAFRHLRPGGLMVCLGPNIRYMTGAYWDYFDHVVPLSERSLSEALALSGFEIDEMIARFLPATISRQNVPPSFVLRTYLRMRPVWRLIGRQFLVVARKPR